MTDNSAMQWVTMSPPDLDAYSSYGSRRPANTDQEKQKTINDHGTPRMSKRRMAISDNNEAWQTFQKSKENSFLSITREFCTTTTTHGISRIMQAQTYAGSFIWAVIFLVSCGFFIGQATNLILQYMDFTVNVKIEVVTITSIRFPSVTVCNTNKLRKSAIQSSEYADMLVIDNNIVYPYYVPCLDSDYQCDNGFLCIKPYLICDGVNNCQDMSDEQNCTYGDCGKDQLKCSSGSDLGVCIDDTYKCNRHKDCYDGEDEDDCTCRSREFKCTEKGGCIEKAKFCDGNIDCTDESDESECELYGDTELTCVEAGYWCEKDGKCLPYSWECDSFADCSDGADEKDCGRNGDDATQCPMGEFKCGSGQCIPSFWVCDEYADCFDGSDEAAGQCGTGGVSGGNSCTDFSCDGGTTCIPQYWVCDNFPDCTDSTDEENCNTGNDYPDFPGSDTGDDFPGSVPVNNDLGMPPWDPEYFGGEYPDLTSDNGNPDTCDGIPCDGKCLDVHVLCNGFNDCLDGIDEANCPESEGATSTTEKPVTTENTYEDTPKHVAHNCTEHQFACHNGECINLYSECNGIIECEDESDEIVSNCTNRFHDVTLDHFPQGWNTPYLLISDDEKHYEDFRENFFSQYGFDRVKGENPPDWNGFRTFSSNPDYSDLEDVLKLSAEEIEKYGHQFEDFVLQCSFNQKNCDFDDFTVLQDDRYGNCFQFNHGKNGSAVRYSRRTGAKYGLKLTLFTEQDEYISIYGRDSGVRVIIQSSDVPVFPEDEGVTIKPGAISSIGIREQVIHRLPNPFGNCTHQSDSDSIYGNDTDHTVLACQKSCVQKHMLKYCGCVDTHIMNAPRCALLNKTQDTCRQLMHYFHQADILPCECKQPCEEKWYEMTLSQSLWPSDKYLKHLLKNIHAINSKTRNINDQTAARSNLVRLEVYFDELNYQDVREVQAYSRDDLLSDIGGSLGLYIGLSLITVCEFIHYMSRMTKLAFKRIFRS